MSAGSAWPLHRTLICPIYGPERLARTCSSPTGSGPEGSSPNETFTGRCQPLAFPHIVAFPSARNHHGVIPAQAGIQESYAPPVVGPLDSRLRGNDTVLSPIMGNETRLLLRNPPRLAIYFAWPTPWSPKAR